MKERPENNKIMKRRNPDMKLKGGQKTRSCLEVEEQERKSLVNMQ